MNGPTNGDGGASGDAGSDGGDSSSVCDDDDSRSSAVADAVRRLLASCRQPSAGLGRSAIGSVLTARTVVAMRTLPDGVARLAWATAGCSRRGLGGRSGRA